MSRIISEIKYLVVALALKGFSLTSGSRRLYRWLGNKYGRYGHSLLSDSDVKQGQWLCQTIRKSGLLLNECSTVLELGTGWTHFYAIFLRFFFEGKTVLFDIQDNRQFGAFQKRVARLAKILIDKEPRESAKSLAEKISKTKNFQELYRLLRMTYVIDPHGRLDLLPSGTFDVVFSIDVLEHIYRDSLTYAVGKMKQLLKPGGISVHQIGLDDHLSHYAPGMPSKNYLRYSDSVWELLYDNRSQHINRVQLPEYLHLFQMNNMELLHCEIEEDSGLLARLTPHAKFRRFDDRSLKAIRASLVHRKPKQ